jgi:glycosyltransferase involved in cell wall biosynthesis
MATYNGEKFIEDQLKSILSQLSINDELIISDDNSSDNTRKIIESFNDKRVLFILNQGKKGYTSNFENALNFASGDIIFLSDQDDVWLPQKVEKVLEELTIYDLVVTNSKVTDENLNIQNSSFFSFYNSGPGIVKNILCNTYYGSCMAFSKKILKKALPFPKNDYVGFDIWIGLVAESIGKVKFINEPLLLYRRSDSSITSLGSIVSRSKKTISYKIMKRLNLIKEILKFKFKTNFN